MAGDWVLVSGGSGGIGSATCTALAQAGYRPIVAYGKNHAGAESTARRTGGWSLALDLSDDASIGSAVEWVTADGLPLAGVILAASPAPVVAPFGRITEADMTAQWRVNVLGPQRLLAALVKQVFRGAKRGFVVGVLSDAMGDWGDRATASMGAYVIGKYGLAGVLAVAAHDYPWLHIRTVRPGFTDTNLLQAFDDRFIEQLRARGVIRRAEEVAADIVAALPAVQVARS
jgi:NAD(P)-dependent dehydrogenase (short-subunit alcohol dehydrogenase family)